MFTRWGIQFLVQKSFPLQQWVFFKTIQLWSEVICICPVYLDLLIFHSVSYVWTYLRLSCIRYLYLLRTETTNVMHNLLFHFPCWCIRLLIMIGMYLFMRTSLWDFDVQVKNAGLRIELFIHESISNWKGPLVLIIVDAVKFNASWIQI